MGLQTCVLNLNRDNRELQPHGTLEFPCAGYASEYADTSGHIVPWHWHDEIEILYIKAGNLKLQIPGKTFHLEKGQGFAINSNILHSASAEPYCNLYSLVFHPLLVTGNADSAFAIRYITPLVHCRAFDGCLLDRLFRANISCTEEFVKAFNAFNYETPGYEFEVRERLSDICYALYENYGHEINSGHVDLDADSRRIRKMLDFIHNHFQENLELAQIAKAADIGERECLRCFKRAIQTSPMQYLLKYRTAQGASMLLKNPGASISDIAGLCGFHSSSSFSQMFGRFYKCTPREYRKNSPP